MERLRSCQYLFAVCVVMVMITVLVVPVSGKMGPVIDKTEIKGDDVAHYHGTMYNNPQICSDACDLDPHCRAATAKPGVSGAEGHCWFKGGEESNLLQVDNPNTVSFTKEPYPYEQLHFPEMAILYGTILSSNGNGFSPCARYPVGVYLGKNNLFKNDPVTIKMIDVIYPDNKGQFTYKYEDRSDPYYWEFLSFKPILPSGKGYFMSDPSITGDGSAKKDFTSPSSKSDGSLLYDLYSMQDGVPITTHAEWRITEPVFTVANSIQKPGARVYTDPVQSENQLSDLLAKSGPALSVDSSHSPLSNLMSTGVLLGIPDFGDSCPKYAFFTLRQEGSLWKYMKQEGLRVLDKDYNPSQNDVKIKCKTGNKVDSNGRPDLTQCIDWDIEINNDKDQMDCGSGSLNLLSVYYTLDYQKIGKNDPYLGGQFLGFQKISPSNIIYIGNNGNDVDSSGIAARSWSNRVYADLLILGDCNRDATVSYADIGAMKDITGQPASFDTVCDMNGDRIVDQKDIDILKKRLGSEGVRGDCNNDGRIDNSDVDYLKMLLVKGTDPGPVPSNCDMNGDIQLTQADLDLLNQKLALAGPSGQPTQSPQGTLQQSLTIVDYSTASSSNGIYVNSDDLHWISPESQLKETLLPQPGNHPEQISDPSKLPCDKEGFVRCNLVCINPRTDSGNCGACGSVCEKPGECVNGQCNFRVEPLPWYDQFLAFPRTIISLMTGSAGSPFQATGSMSLAEPPTIPSADDKEAPVNVAVLPGTDDQQIKSDQNSERVVPLITPTLPEQPVHYTQVYMTESPEGPNLTPSPEPRISITETYIASEPQMAPVKLPCPSGYVTCNGQCVNLMLDTNDCGSCNTVCPSGLECFSGMCNPPCTSEQTRCNGICVNLLTSANDCGACGHPCINGYCSNGTCISFSCTNNGQTICNGVCINLLTDPNNCGSCGNVCMSGGTCENGQCVVRMATTQPTGIGNTGITRPHI